MFGFQNNLLDTIDFKVQWHDYARLLEYIDGFYTNHSLQATTATHLFHYDVDEQLIMERTGHRLTDRVRSYKRLCMKQQQIIYQLLNSDSHHQQVQIQRSQTDVDNGNLLSHSTH